MFWVYAIRNERSGKIYIGQTSDLNRRLKRHNKLLPTKLRSYTAINKGFWVVIYKEQYQTRSEAIKREKYLKSHIGRDWLKTILGR
jgi:putative endonuclease